MTLRVQCVRAVNHKEDVSLNRLKPVFLECNLFSAVDKLALATTTAQPTNFRRTSTRSGHQVRKPERFSKQFTAITEEGVLQWIDENGSNNSWDGAQSACTQQIPCVNAEITKQHMWKASLARLWYILSCDCFVSL